MGCSKNQIVLTTRDTSNVVAVPFTSDVSIEIVQSDSNVIGMNVLNNSEIILTYAFINVVITFCIEDISNYNFRVTDVNKEAYHEYPATNTTNIFGGSYHGDDVNKYALVIDSDYGRRLGIYYNVIGRSINFFTQK